MSLFSNMWKVDLLVYITVLYIYIKGFFFLSALFTFGGSNGAFFNISEAINISPPVAHCPAVARLPQRLDGITGATLNGRPVACGGWVYG